MSSRYIQYRPQTNEDERNRLCYQATTVKEEVVERVDIPWHDEEISTRFSALRETW